MINSTLSLTFQILPNSTGLPATQPTAFVLGMPLMLYGQVSVHGQVLSGKITNSSSSLTFLSSPYGKFDPSIISSVFSVLVDHVAIPVMSAILEQGFDLPLIANVALDQPMLQYHDGYVAVMTNVKYSPPPTRTTVFLDALSR